MSRPAFTCRQCGHCCQGRGGIVLTDHDTARLAGHARMEPEAFLDRYSEEFSGRTVLRSGDDGWCVFFDQGCTVHPARPDICRAWPFFRGNLVDKDSWRMVEDYCPGVDHAAGHDEFVRQGLDYLGGLHAVRHPGPDTPTALRNLPPRPAPGNGSEVDEGDGEGDGRP